MFENLSLFYLLVGAAIAALAIWRTTIASPISIFATFNVLCAAYFYWTVDLGHRPEAQLSSMTLMGLEGYSDMVGRFYLMLSVICLPVIYSVPRITGADFATMAVRFRVLLTTKALVVFLGFVTFLTIVHLVDFDLRYFWSYRGYHAIDEKEAVGISNPISRLYHMFGPTLAALSLCVAIVCYHTGRRGLVLPGVMLGIYGFMLAVASASREIAVFFFLPALTHYLFRKRLDVLSVAGFVMSAFAIIFAVEARSKYGDLGLSHAPNVISRIRIENFTESLFSVLSNVTQGAVGMGHAFRISPEYPFAYKWVSALSPFPSAIDNWYAIREQFQVKIAPPVPIGSLGETYHFGWPYIVGLLIVTLWILRRTTIQMFRQTSVLTIPIYGFTLLLIYRLHHYPMRISQRIIIVLLALYIIDYLLRQRRKAMDRRKAARAMARRGPVPPGRAVPALPRGRG